MDPFITIFKVFTKLGHHPDLDWLQHRDFFADGQFWSSYCTECDKNLAYTSRNLFEETRIIRIRVDGSIVAHLTGSGTLLMNPSSLKYVCEKYKIFI